MNDTFRHDPALCGYAWKCWHFMATAETSFGRVLIAAAIFAVVLWVIGWIFRRFDL